MEHEFSSIKVSILLRVPDRYSRTRQPVYFQLIFGFRTIHLPSTYAISMRGPVNEFAWYMDASQNVVLLGTRTFRGSAMLHRSYRLDLLDGMDIFTFEPCYIQVTGQSNYGMERHYTANDWDQGVTVYEDIDTLSQLILLVEIGPTFTNNREQFSITYSGMEEMWTMITDDSDDFDN